MALSRIKTNSIADSAITGAKISDGTVVASDIAALSVDSTKLASSAVTNTKLSTNAVSIDKVDSTVTQAFGMRNRIINGAMVIDQRNAGASFTVNETANLYALDRWCTRGETTDGAYTVQRVTDAPVGFSYSQKITVTTADSSIGATQVYRIFQPIEGYNVADLNFGSANAKTITVSFWAKSSIAGTFGGSVNNDGYSRSYPFSFTISAANTWEYKTITIPGDTSGTWLTTNGVGLSLSFNIGAGTDRKGTAGAWNSSINFSSTSATNIISTNGATFYITGVQLEVGSSATPFDTRAYGAELALCQRYHALLTNTSTAGEQCFAVGSQLTTSLAGFFVAAPVPMRAEPTVAISNLGVSDQIAFTNAATISSIAATPNGSGIFATHAAAGAQYRPCYLVSRNTLIGKIQFSAEL